MTEILSSNGDLSSTPSNRSEYFSVTSSLNVLDSTEEVYHSLDEENNPNVELNSQQVFIKKIEHHKIFKQQHLDIDTEENGYKKSTSIETIPESLTCRNSLECEFWDKYLQPLRVVKSQNSLNSFEEDCNNSSMFSNSLIKDSSITEEFNNNESSDNEESNSCSINVTTQLNTSQIDGELSDINDIIYESKISPVNGTNEMIPKENHSSEIENENIDELSGLDIPIEIDKNHLTPEIYNEPIKFDDETTKDNLSIYEMVKQLENSQLESSMIQEENLPVNDEGNILFIDESNEKKPPKKQSIQDENGKNFIENVEDSPIKRSYLCCSLRKSKNKSENKKPKKLYNIKSKRIFSFFKKSNNNNENIIIKEQNEKELIREHNNICNNPILIKSNSIDYDGIPYIDADVAIDTEAYISLAKQELFSDL